MNSIMKIALKTANKQQISVSFSLLTTLNNPRKSINKISFSFNHSRKTILNSQKLKLMFKIPLLNMKNYKK